MTYKSKFNHSTQKLDIGAVNETDGIYAPVTNDNKIHDKFKKFIPAGGHIPDEPKTIDGKEVKFWIPIPD